MLKINVMNKKTVAKYINLVSNFSQFCISFWISCKFLYSDYCFIDGGL